MLILTVLCVALERPTAVTFTWPYVSQLQEDARHTSLCNLCLLLRELQLKATDVISNSRGDRTEPKLDGNCFGCIYMTLGQQSWPIHNTICRSKEGSKSLQTVRSAPWAFEIWTALQGNESTASCPHLHLAAFARQCE